MKNSRPSSRSSFSLPSDVSNHSGPPVSQLQPSEERPSGDCHERMPSALWSSQDENGGQRSVTRHSFPSLSATAAHDDGSPELLTRRRRAEANFPSERSTAKRIRREFSSASRNSKDRSSPDSDSQGGMADNEMELTTADKKEQALPAPPPKKKRTRTLTTPHQSAVLHALLAQSRFPTTAMREEVGRSIGLSARKVQIWFQNQRQKARRPRAQADVVANIPSQYGPSPDVAESSSSVHRYGGARTHYSHPSQRTSAFSSGTPVRLLGPGIPGQHQMNSYRHMLSTSSPVEPTLSLGPIYPRTPSPDSHLSSLPSAQPGATHPAGWHERGMDPSRTLPPLLPTMPLRAHTLPSFWGQPTDTSRHSVHTHQSFSPEQRSIQVSEAALAARTHFHIPPPFTLQPAPQWDDSSYIPRPNSYPWSQLNFYSSRVRSNSHTVPRREPARNIGRREARSEPYHTIERRSALASSQQSGPSTLSSMPLRPGRYDPVRAVITTSLPTFMARDREDRSRNGDHGPSH